ncbi:hypothetical protein BDK51DRAFT_41928 [Blyttiomyces helicus]|uniref:Secreted protein n=1 Tax=Blyttiomyces helicus TaxID=388810 RepID=A0A4P9WEJ7_9FUNG|nr:hypothetical protein BDK51DRAFT_41928 [Blyttiomyces helicus]|eukprot:RKO88816.1 hypothetical protein BDK51DRAFT_41928 [Blyttiomyces helicus]
MFDLSPPTSGSQLFMFLLLPTIGSPTVPNGFDAGVSVRIAGWSRRLTWASVRQRGEDEHTRPSIIFVHFLARRPQDSGDRLSVSMVRETPTRLHDCSCITVEPPLAAEVGVVLGVHWSVGGGRGIWEIGRREKRAEVHPSQSNLVCMEVEGGINSRRATPIAGLSAMGANFSSPTDLSVETTAHQQHHVRGNYALHDEPRSSISVQQLPVPNAHFFLSPHNWIPDRSKRLRCGVAVCMTGCSKQLTYLGVGSSTGWQGEHEHGSTFECSLLPFSGGDVLNCATCAPPVA